MSMCLKAKLEEVILLIQCGTSSVGRASACQAEGRRFETGVPHHISHCYLHSIYYYL